MGYQTVIVYHSPSGREPPVTLRTVAEELGVAVVHIIDSAEVMALVNRTLPRAIVLDGSAHDAITKLTRRLKSDAFSAIVPVIVLSTADGQTVVQALEAGADEVLTEVMPER